MPRNKQGTSISQHVYVSACVSHDAGTKQGVWPLCFGTNKAHRSQHVYVSACVSDDADTKQGVCCRPEC